VTLEEKIKEEIRRNGPISFERFMEMALYLPGYGYYMKRKPVFGPQGDYYTASHLGPIFGSAIALQMREFSELLGQDRFTIVEAGAGTGLTALHVLEYLRVHERELFDRTDYIIVELNPYLRNAQRQRLRGFKNVMCFERLEEVPMFSGAFFSNELFDALPVRIVEQRGGLKEILVDLWRDKFVEVYRDAPGEIVGYFQDLNILPEEGFRTEVNLRAKGLIHRISERMERGFVLTVDYGLSAKEYLCTERKAGTLLCYFRHTFHDDPYVRVGDQDITAHVNFSALKVFGEQVSLRTIGYTPLCLYLLSCGILKHHEETANLQEKLEMKTLLLPEGFGESHKVMVQYKGEGSPSLRGFSLKNMVCSL
jgi:SAM-dependent MidA family methyltransferase